MQKTLKTWTVLPTLLALSPIAMAEPAPATLRSKTLAGWNTYVELTEKRIDREIRQEKEFLLMDSKPDKERDQIQQTLKSGQIHVEKMETRNAGNQEIRVDSGMIHHWYGAVFIPNVTLPAVIRWVQNYEHHSEYFDDVEQSKLISQNGEDFRIFLRLVRKKVVTVHYNTEHAVTYTNHGPSRVSSQSVAERISEIADAGGPTESEKTADDDSGFLWRLNSYWRYEEKDGGVYVECESISLSRSIPFGLGWLVGPFVQSVPRESLTGMLSSIRDANSVRWTRLENEE